MKERILTFYFHEMLLLFYEYIYTRNGSHILTKLH